MRAVARKTEPLYLSNGCTEGMENSCILIFDIVKNGIICFVGKHFVAEWVNRFIAGNEQFTDVVVMNVNY